MNQYTKHKPNFALNTAIFKNATAFVTNLTGICLEDILSKRKKEDIVLARHLTMFLLNVKEQISLNLTGNLLNADHTTVMHGVKQTENRMSINKRLKNAVDSYPIAKFSQYFISIAKIDDKLEISGINTIEDEKYELLLNEIKDLVNKYNVQL